MKRVFALVLTAILAAVLCIGACAESYIYNRSWDGIYVNGSAVAVGNAGGWLESHEIKGEITNIRVVGWIYITGKIKGFAYTVDGGEAVRSADFIAPRPDVKNAISPDAEGFDITVDVEKIGVGEHLISIYVIDDEDDLVDTEYVLPFTQELDPNAVSEPENPGSGDAAIIVIAAAGCIALAGAVIVGKNK